MATEITTWAELAAINSALSGDYILMNDLDSTSPGYDTYASSSANGGAGWITLGKNLNSFRGGFDGQNHRVSDLYINRPSTDYIGLFGHAIGATITNTHIQDCNITGNDHVGALVGYINNPQILDCSSTGTITGANNGDNIGGLIGSSGGTADVERCFSGATVYGYQLVGGLIGQTGYGTFKNLYACGAVTATREYAGGLVGVLGNLGASTISNCYACGEVTSPSSLGGFTGLRVSSSTATNCFWDIDTSGTTRGGAGTGKTTAQMQDISTFSAWDISAVADRDTRDTTHIWNIVDDSSYPFLSSEVAPIAPSGDVTGEIVKSVTSNIFGNIIKPIM